MCYIIKLLILLPLCFEKMEYEMFLFNETHLLYGRLGNFKHLFKLYHNSIIEAKCTSA